ncbi:glutamine synthetase family protein [Psychromarinibacter sp. C21-152]|uniref:Glutamine synthetase family protein n=1 Tax=Psychromarinibacter sediminicola TaxID=3033385 RepID=A0AAE3T8H7_9RHOB|nr:glutamine synthetase family protein [Psychromarinibacter sediminicola]MDF0601430.1 glutamine synthetase family protein [Psychromarinibacter sediminicola]
MKGFLDEFAAYEARHGTPDRLELLLPDINAIHRGKWLPGTDAKKLADGGVRLPLSTYAPNIMGEEIAETGLGMAVGDPDAVMVPVEGTLKPVPWAEGHVAQVQCEMTEDGEIVSPLSARDKLSAMLARFADRGLTPVIATELEFYIFCPRETPDEPPSPPPHAPDAQNYELNVLDRTQDILTEIQQASAAQGLATDSLIAEYGPGQYEINFHHTDDALEAADTAVLFRRLVRGVVARHGMEASFMAKPYAEHPGNGMHVHVSVTGGDGNIFAGDGEAISDTLGHAVAGVLATMSDAQAVLAPHLNSFRRFAPGSFSPNRPDWGLDHRGAAVRLPDIAGAAARLEHRIGGADCNPYLAITAILGGVLHGLDATPELPLPIDDPSAPAPQPLAHDWRTAVDAFAASDFIAEVFGDRFRHIFATLKYDEIAKLTSEITPVEYRIYLGRL